MPTLDFKGKSFVYAHHLSVPFRELVVEANKSLPPRGQKPSLDDNLIIHGDNLHALKALLPVYAGKVDCIFIDPPYNTGNEAWCYNDNVRSPLMREWLKKASPVDKEDLERHDKWLCMMWPRLKLLHELLSEDGVVFITIDDNEVYHLVGLLDEVFGEDNFLSTCIWHKMDSPKNTAQNFSVDHDYVVIYAKSKESRQLNLLPRNEEMLARYRNPDNDPRGAWLLSDLDARNAYSKGLYPITTPKGRVIAGPPKGKYWRISEEKFKAMVADNRIWWGTDGDADPNIKRFLSEVRDGVIPQTIWHWEEVGSTRNAKTELLSIIGDGAEHEIFITPKPTDLVRRALQIASKPNSIVLDSFAGSGTTAHAVLALNKKDGGNRKFILVESEDYADTVTAERVRRVIEGYKFQGTQREELWREPLTFTSLKNADKLLEKADSFELLDGKRFDRITKTVEDGTLVVTGEKKITEKVDGLGGSFTFASLGPEMSLDKLLADGLPTREALARYVFFTATGRTLTDVPGQKSDSPGFIGETDMYRVHLLYKPEKAWLQSNDAALTEKLVDAMLASNTERKKLLIFAAAKFMSQRDLSRLGVEFCQLPYAIHRILGD
jgi:adenine-specific DNA-methyltransferase